MDQRPQDIVDDFIHETYLDTLDEAEVLEDLQRFSEICGRVISETIHDGRKIVELNRRLTAIRQKQMLAASDDEPRPASWASSSAPRVSRARRVVHNKRLILTAIREISPTTAERIRTTVHPVAAPSPDPATAPQPSAQSAAKTALAITRRAPAPEPRRSALLSGSLLPPLILFAGLLITILLTLPH